MILKLSENIRLNKMLLIGYQDPSDIKNNIDHTLTFEICDRINDDDIMGMLLKKYKVYSSIEITGAIKIMNILSEINSQILSIIPIDVIDYCKYHFADNSISNTELYNLLKSNNIKITNLISSSIDIVYPVDYSFSLDFILYITNCFNNINIAIKDNKNKYIECDPFNIGICFVSDNDNNTYSNEEEEILLLLSIVKKYCALKLFCDDVNNYIFDYVENI